MVGEAAEESNYPFVMDVDCLIRMARAGLLDRLPPDDSLIIVPFKVDEEVRRYRNPKSRVKAWLDQNRHLVKRFQTNREHVVYYRLISEQGEQLGEGEAAAIALALARQGTFASDDKKALEIAETLGVSTITSANLARRVVLKLL